MHGMVNNWQGEKKTSIPMRGDYEIQSLLFFSFFAKLCDSFAIGTQLRNTFYYIQILLETPSILT